MAFVEVPELDINTLLHLSDRDLLNACQTNRYVSQVCDDPYFWRRRISIYVDDKYAEDKPEDISWRVWYFFWHNNYPDSIGDRLNLSPLQAAIRLVTQDDIVIGSEAFQTINVTLTKAFQTQDQEIIDYFMTKLRQIARQYFRLNLPFNPLLNYTETITAALEGDYLDLTTELLDLMVADWNKLSREDYDMNEFQHFNTIAEVLGFLGLIDYFETIFLPRVSDVLLETDWTPQDFFLTGLIRGHHNTEAKTRLIEIVEIVENNKETFDFLYTELIGPAVQSNNQEIIKILDSRIPLDDLPNYRRKKRYQELRRRPETYNSYKKIFTPQEIFSAIVISDPILADQYYQEHQGNIDLKSSLISLKICYSPLLNRIIGMSSDIITNIIDYQTCPIQAIIDVVIAMKGNHYPRKKYTIVIQKTLDSGRYDLLPFLDQVIENLHLEEDEETLLRQDLLKSMEWSNYKDIYLYLLIDWITRYPDLPVTIVVDPTLILGSLESYLLRQQLENLSNNQIIQSDLYSLLIQPYA